MNYPGALGTGAHDSMGQLAVTFASGLFSILLALALPRACVAQGLQIPSPIPADCQAPEETAGSPVASQESYDRLGTLYGRAGNFRCAVAAFETALSLNREATQTRYK